jgi:hypothetical protein
MPHGTAWKQDGSVFGESGAEPNFAELLAMWRHSSTYSAELKSWLM